MDYSPELRSSRNVGEIQLDVETPAVDQSFLVASSRLVHLHLQSPGEFDGQSLVRALLVDSTGNVLTQVALRPGTSRSAPLTFLDPGDYTLRFAASTEAESLPEIRVNLFLDEVSIDVGPGVSDPTGNPYLPCNEPGADPDFCYQYIPITPEPPTLPDSQTGSPWGPGNPWWWEYGFSCSDYSPDQYEVAQAVDPLWWEFAVDVCQATTIPPTTTPPTTTPPTTTPPTTTPPTTTPPTTTPPTTNPPAGVSPWQNSQDKYDVTGNQTVSSLDALIIINQLRHAIDQKVDVLNVATDFYTDVNGDFIVSALDALLVINAIANQQVAEAEAVMLPVAAIDTVHKDPELILPPSDGPMLF